LLFTFFYTAVVGQITEAEKRLKTVNADTVTAWKKGGVFAAETGTVYLNLLRLQAQEHSLKRF
jgi:hypothetical protein